MALSVVASMVRVKLGTDSRTGEAVAIKIMYKDNMTARAAQQLRREITSMKALNHPNILRLKDVHEVGVHERSRWGGGDVSSSLRVGVRTDSSLQSD